MKFLDNMVKQIEEMDDEKLLRELSFARAAADIKHPATYAWLDALEDEAQYRGLQD